MATDDESDSTFDPKRRLCADDACIGVIGADGRCKVCGGPPAEQQEDALAVPRPSDALPPEEGGDLPEASPEEPEQGGGFNPQRRLCSDGSCIGVIGADNRCHVCGKPA
jgi:hypothetical protein